MELRHLVDVRQRSEAVDEVHLRAEFGRLDEVQQRPQFVHVVLSLTMPRHTDLERGSCEKQLGVRVDLLQRREELRVLTLRTLRLVDNHILPVDVLEHVKVRHQNVVGRQQHVELIDTGMLMARKEELIATDTLATLLSSVRMITTHDATRKERQNDVQVGTVLNFSLPVAQRRQRRQHEERTANALHRVEVVQQCNRLQVIATTNRDLERLAQSHFVSKNAVATLVPRKDQPVHSLDLVFTEDNSVLQFHAFFVLLVRLRLRTLIAMVNHLLFLYLKGETRFRVSG